MNFIGSGVTFHAPSFFRELQALEDKGLTNVKERILVSDRFGLEIYYYEQKLTIT